jgi:hypothetical protein
VHFVLGFFLDFSLENRNKDTFEKGFFFWFFFFWENKTFEDPDYTTKKKKKGGKIKENKKHPNI